ncbi:branched-chain amino acid aminotransferase [[Clostridium] dakarense]|uniref:branched-chain amino acid aminotransferase n=1 Tax=Faecalimicrobium dakarense TaxID=1301100 RepID=UPI0004AF6F67|nr:branched-chain amino acid aminotransferase [[Clostridium] dakarense]
MDWANLGFKYTKTDFRYISVWKDGEWDEGILTEDNRLSISEGSTAIHYGQQCFEGLKAYRTKSGDIQLFRPDENSKRLNDSCDRLLMPQISSDKFIDACKQVIKANERFVPPYGSNASLYLRPFVIGVGDNIGVKAAQEYIFCVFCVPVGAYFKGDISPVNFIVSDYDRAASKGTGSVKVGGNYACSFYPNKLAKDRGFADCIYLDPQTHSKIEEVGAANFYAITKENVFITPKSESILPSITKKSLIYIAQNHLNMKVEERDIFIDELSELKEAGACGTAAVITPIGMIEDEGKQYTFNGGEEAGEITKKLYKILTEIQFGDREAPEGWIFKA